MNLSNNWELFKSSLFGRICPRHHILPPRICGDQPADKRCSKLRWYISQLYGFQFDVPLIRGFATGKKKGHQKKGNNKREKNSILWRYLTIYIYIHNIFVCYIHYLACQFSSHLRSYGWIFYRLAKIFDSLIGSHDRKRNLNESSAWRFGRSGVSCWKPPGCEVGILEDHPRMK